MAPNAIVCGDVRVVPYARILFGAVLTAEADQNPLLAAWSGPYGGVPPWDRAKPELFAPAFTAGLA